MCMSDDVVHPDGGRQANSVPQVVSSAVTCRMMQVPGLCQVKLIGALRADKTAKT